LASAQAFRTKQRADDCNHEPREMRIGEMPEDALSQYSAIRNPQLPIASRAIRSSCGLRRFVGPNGPMSPYLTSPMKAMTKLGFTGSAATAASGLHDSAPARTPAARQSEWDVVVLGLRRSH
jgi:hypothetical protein